MAEQNHITLTVYSLLTLLDILTGFNSRQCLVFRRRRSSGVRPPKELAQHFRFVGFPRSVNQPWVMQCISLLQLCILVVWPCFNLLLRWGSLSYTSLCHCVKRVKFSHTRYWVLGPELIPVYRQSAYRWPCKSSLGGRLLLLSSRPAVTFPAKEHHCLSTSTKLTTEWCVNNLSKVVM